MLFDVSLCKLIWFYQFISLPFDSGIYLRMLYGHYHHITSYRNVKSNNSIVFSNISLISSDVPWYSDSEWNNVKGQLSTVDRHYGPVHSVIHSIGTHQIHHLFTKVPHYHLGMN